MAGIVWWEIETADPNSFQRFHAVGAADLHTARRDRARGRPDTR
ncbi:hypothetical protein AS96_12190 [Microbacterium sp. MRS-1]|nr:hypothetical protein AS96_12190 [Microbacterium sp. MRS-1]